MVWSFNSVISEPHKAKITDRIYFGHIWCKYKSTPDVWYICIEIQANFKIEGECIIYDVLVSLPILPQAPAGVIANNSLLKHTFYN